MSWVPGGSWVLSGGYCTEAELKKEGVEWKTQKVRELGLVVVISFI